MYSLAACFLQSRVQPMYDTVYTKDKIREGFQWLFYVLQDLT